MSTLSLKIGALSAGLLATISLAACGRAHDGRPAETATPVPVETALAAETEALEFAEVTGAATPITRVSPGTKIMGRVEKVFAREGDRVRAGQSLAALDERDLRAGVAQAEAAVKMAEASRENAAATHRRIAGLHERGSATDKNLDDAVAGLHVAEAGLEQAKANLSAAQAMLGYAEIRTPISGFVTAKRVEAGDMAGPGAPLFTVEDLSRIKVIVQVPEAQVVGVAAGQAARVRVDVLDEEREARVDRVAPAGDPLSRTFEVQLLLDNPDERIKSGMFVRAKLGRGARPALLTPQSAVVRRGALTGLFIVDADGAARLRWVRLGRDRDGQVEVISGLAPGERFVVSPPASLTDGAPVAVR